MRESDGWPVEPDVLTYVYFHQLFVDERRTGPVPWKLERMRGLLEASISNSDAGASLLELGAGFEGLTDGPFESEGNLGPAFLPVAYLFGFQDLVDHDR